MQDQRTRGNTARSGTAPLNQAAPSSSRMLTSYMSDIEQLLDEQQWETAQREALDLPEIAVALSDRQLSTNAERLKAWCDQWVRPEVPDRNARGADYARVSAQALAHTGRVQPVTVPSLALKRLRLRRLVRTPPRGFSSGRSGPLDPEANNALETCSILVEAARRWYAQSAVHDPIVQANLARLAVLR